MLELPEVVGLQDLDLSTVETERPELAQGQYPWKVTAVELAPTKNDSTKFMLNIECALQTGDAKSIDGKDIKLGYKLTNRIMVTPSGDLTVDMIAQKLKAVCLAIFGGHPPTFRGFDWQQIVGGEFMASTVVGKDNKGRLRAEFDRMLKKAA